MCAQHYAQHGAPQESPFGFLHVLQVLRYAQQIVDRGLQRSVMEIDDRLVRLGAMELRMFIPIV